MIWTQSQAHIMTPDVFRLAMKARGDLKMRCNALMGMVHRAEGLRASYERLAQNKGPGVDGVKKKNDAVGLDDRLADLSARLTRGLTGRNRPAACTSEKQTADAVL